MRRRNLVVTSDSDEEDGERTTTTASVSVSVASGGGGGGGSGSVGRPSPPNPSPLPVPFPSFSPTSAPVVISDDEEEEVEEILDSDGDSPFIDVPEDFSPPSPPAPPPPAARTTTSAPPPLVARTPTSAPPHPAAWTPTSAPPAPAARTPTPAAPFPAARTPTSAPPSAQTPAPTPPPARTPTPTAPPASTPPPASLSGRLRPVYELLRRLGLRLRPEWLESWAAGVPGFDGLGGPEGQARRCFEQFLFADMNACGAGVLPEGVGSMHAAILDGPFVLQVDEIVNISAPLRERYHGAHVGPKRCLKLSMTDGIQRIFGMEYRPIKELEVLAPAGLKILIRNVHIRRGLLMLVPEVIEILGGVVDELEAARDRLVSEVNNPPRGKRKQGGLPLSSRATLAAWPCSTNVTNGGEQGISMPRAVNSSYTTGLGNAFPVGRTTETIVEEHVRPPVVVNSVQEQSRHVPKINMQDQSTSLTRENTETRRVQEINMQDLSTSLSRENTEAQRVQEISMQDLSTFTRKNTETWRVQEINMLDLSTSLTRKNTEAQGVQEICTHSTDRVTQTIIEEYVDPPIIANSAHEQIQRVQEITMQEQATAFARTETRSSAPTPCEYDSHHGSHGIGGTGANDVEAARSSNLDDEIYQMEHSFILSGENEKPYTYIYSMLVDWGMQQDTKAYIQGKIKGLITSVKSFQYKRRIEYELYVYIDDGSYISEAFVDNDIVKNMLGLSPGELTAALAGESELASASEIKETMKGFQRFLVKFEGTMLVEFNKNSSIPIVRELSEGCSSSDAWLLLRRLKTFSSERHMQNLDIMDTTP